MIGTSLAQLTAVLDAQLVGEDTEIAAVSTDTRSIPQDALFVALVGERFDAHEFAAQAVAAGAKALLVERVLDINVPQLVVANSKIALGLLGSWFISSVIRRRLPSRAVAAKPR